jgi:hypothetical protein
MSSNKNAGEPFVASVAIKHCWPRRSNKFPILLGGKTMSDPVLIALIIAAAVVIALIIFRRQLGSFLFKATKDGIEAELKTQTHAAVDGTSNSTAGRSNPVNVNIKRNRLFGWGNRIDVERDDADIEENTQLGGNQDITVKSDRPSRKKK